MKCHAEGRTRPPAEVLLRELVPTILIGAFALIVFAWSNPGAAAAACPNEGFRVGASAALPECRAYELVSPVDKGTGEVTPNLSFASAEDGGRFIYQSFQGFADVVSAGVVTDYLATRSASGWSTHAISPPVPSDFQASSNYPKLSPDLSKGILSAWPARAPVAPLTSDTPPGRSIKWYVGELSSDTYQLLSTAVPPLTFPPDTWFAAGSASRDFGKVSFSAEGAELAPGASGTRNVYELSGGQIRLASILPDSFCGAPPCVASSADIAGSGAIGLEISERSVSEDGSRVFFTAAASFEQPEGVYVREDGTTTQRIGAPGAYWYSASQQDGSKVLFEDHLCGLCIVDLENDETVQVDVDSELADGSDGAVGIVDVSADLSRVYFGSTGQLTPGEGEPGPLVGARNMYVWDEGELKFVGFFEEPGVGDLNELFHNQGQTNVGGLLARSRQTDLTPDGSRLLFMSRSQPTGYDNSNPDCDKYSDERCGEIYVYDLEADGGAGELTCVTCQPGGSTADSTLMGEKGFGQKVKQRNLSIDGRLAFFESGEPLVGSDGNGVVDVYGYDIDAGTLFLVSTGSSADASRYGGSSDDGSTVFFTTRQRLVGQDIDKASDAYAARVGGGFQPPPPPPPACEGEECQGASTPVPAATPPASSSLVGPPNPAPKRKKHQRCGKAAKGKAGKGKAVKKCGKGKGKKRNGKVKS